MTRLTDQTKTQIKRILVQIGVTAELKGKGKDWEVEFANEKDKNKFTKVVSCGGYRTGYGGWVMRPHYEGLGEFGDRTSRHHY